MGSPRFWALVRGWRHGLPFQKGINSRCLMTPCDSLVGNVVTGLHVALCSDDSFVHHPEATEPVKTYYMVSEGFWLVQISIRLTLRCGIFW
jgi:hypothetical protein